MHGIDARDANRERARVVFAPSRNPENVPATLTPAWTRQIAGENTRTLQRDRYRVIEMLGIQLFRSAHPVAALKAFPLLSEPECNSQEFQTASAWRSKPTGGRGSTVTWLPRKTEATSCFSSPALRKCTGVRELVLGVGDRRFSITGGRRMRQSG
jgi:hypothetical protein